MRKWERKRGQAGPDAFSFPRIMRKMPWGNTVEGGIKNEKHHHFSFVYNHCVFAGCGRCGRRRQGQHPKRARMGGGSRRSNPRTIPDGDYAYLRVWIDRNAKPADDYFVGLFKHHDVVIFGEAHDVREHKLFIINLVPRLYREAGVRCIGWEFPIR